QPYRSQATIFFRTLRTLSRLLPSFQKPPAPLPSRKDSQRGEQLDIAASVMRQPRRTLLARSELSPDSRAHSDIRETERGPESKGFQRQLSALATTGGVPFASESTRDLRWT